jgi:Fur family peroxide stress response transcriptional regulator
MKSLTEVRDLFKTRKVPLTHQRLAVYKELSSRRDHPSAESLYDSLRKDYPSLSLATVYKTLQTLHHLGMISRVDSPTAQARYDAIIEAHHHMVCSSCGLIADIFDRRLDKLPAPKSTAFRIDGHSVHFYGLCSQCAQGQPLN